MYVVQCGASQRCKTFFWQPLKDTVSQTDVTSPLNMIFMGGIANKLFKAGMTRKQALPGCLSSRLFLFAPRNSLPEPTE